MLELPQDIVKDLASRSEADRKEINSLLAHLSAAAELETAEGLVYSVASRSGYYVTYVVDEGTPLVISVGKFVEPATFKFSATPDSDIPQAR